VDAAERVQAARAPPVENARRVAVAHLDQAQLLEPAERLAHGCHVDLELSRERPLRGQPVAGCIAVAENRLAQLPKDVIGYGHPRDGRGGACGVAHGLASVSVFRTLARGRRMGLARGRRMASVAAGDHSPWLA